MSNEEMIALELTKIEYATVKTNHLPSDMNEKVLKSYEFYTYKLKGETKAFPVEADLSKENEELTTIINKIRMAICEDNNSFVDKGKLTDIVEGRIW